MQRPFAAESSEPKVVEVLLPEEKCKVGPFWTPGADKEQKPRSSDAINGVPQFLERVDELYLLLLYQ